LLNGSPGSSGADAARPEEAEMNKRRVTSRAAVTSRRRRRRRAPGDPDLGRDTAFVRRDVFVLGEMIAQRPEVTRILS
jgi:hypothetical protein